MLFLLIGCLFRSPDLPVNALEGYDPERAVLGKSDLFPRLRVSDSPPLLSQSALADDERLLVMSKGGVHLAFSVREMSYYHVAQGRIDGAPYLVVF